MVGQVDLRVNSNPGVHKGGLYPDISWGVKFARANVGFENGVLTLPHSTAFLLRRVLDGQKGGR